MQVDLKLQTALKAASTNKHFTGSFSFFFLLSDREQLHWLHTGMHATIIRELLFAVTSVIFSIDTILPCRSLCVLQTLDICKKSFVESVDILCPQQEWDMQVNASMSCPTSMPSNARSSEACTPVVGLFAIAGIVQWTPGQGRNRGPEEISYFCWSTSTFQNALPWDWLFSASTSSKVALILL